MIVTRPAEDAAALAEKLAARGIEALLAPLLTIVPRKGIVIPPAAYQAVCLTSANGAAILREHPALARLPAYAVGAQSAAAARAAGFANVEAHGGDVEGLCSFIVKNCKPENGPLLYVSGAATSGDLAGVLGRHGFTMERVIAYDAVPQDMPDAAELIARAQAVLLYSPRTARLWQAQIEKHGLQDHMKAMPHLCLSAAVAHQLPAAWPRRVAEAPHETAMLAALDRLREAE
ncbi:MAG: uroporphyrinogen-III synthase [Hyphomicrobiales bacterium]